jgi:hypothetical protein
MSQDSLNEDAANPAGPIDTDQPAVTVPGDDPRLQRGAYVTDGVNLYEITALRRGPGQMGLSTVRVVVENCRNFARVEFLPDKIRRSFSLVRRAPVARCPDLVEEIDW